MAKQSMSILLLDFLIALLLSNLNRNYIASSKIRAKAFEDYYFEHIYNSTVLQERLADGYFLYLNVTFLTLE